MAGVMYLPFRIEQLLQVVADALKASSNRGWDDAVRSIREEGTVCETKKANDTRTHTFFPSTYTHAI